MRLSRCIGQGVLQHPVTDLLVPGQTSPASHGRAPADIATARASTQVRHAMPGCISCGLSASV